MTFFARLRRLAVRGPEHDGDATHVSTATREAIVRHEQTRGIDWTTWRSPKELAAIQAEQEGQP